METQLQKIEWITRQSIGQANFHGRLHRSFLKEYHPTRYSHLRLEGQLWNHLVEINKLCKKRMEVMVGTMKKQEGVSEALKVSEQMEWVHRMNSIHNQAEETVLHKLVYGEFNTQRL